MRLAEPVGFGLEAVKPEGYQYCPSLKGFQDF